MNRLVDAWRARWTIEEFFKALKTGCSFLQRELEDYEALVNALAVSIPIACRALLLRTRARLQPDSEEIMLDADELLVLREQGCRKLPAQPTNRAIRLAVAALGGHIKWNGEPGWKTICEGLETLLPLTQGFRLARKLLRASDQDETLVSPKRAAETFSAWLEERAPTCRVSFGGASSVA